MRKMSEKKLLLIDAYTLIFRAYYAFIKRPIKNSKGLNTSAIFGFTSSLFEVLGKENPSHIAVVFDPPSPTFRHKLYKDYKANRLKTPEDIKLSVPYIKEIIKGFNIEVVEVENFEADDVIGTLAKRAEKEGFRTYMMTSDKDYTQLVSENILIYKPSRAGNEAEIVNIEDVRENFKVKDPINVIDVMALWGDASDNIPGVPGIGEKSAKNLIKKYKTVEEIYNHLDELTGKQKENMLKFREQAVLSKKLVTISLEVPVKLKLDTLAVKGIDKVHLAKIFNELEFRTLASRIISENKVTPEKRTEVIQGELFNQDIIEDKGSETEGLNSIKTTDHNYHLVDSSEKRQKLIARLYELKELSFDTETTTLDVMQAQLVGLAFAFNPHEAYYVPFPPDIKLTRDLADEFKNIFENDKIKKIGQNIKYDIQVLSNYDIEVKGTLFDTMISHYLIEPELKHNLDFLSGHYLNYKPVSIEELIGKKGKNQQSMRDVDLDIISEYACEDADLTWQLYKILENELKVSGLIELSEKIEMPLISVLSDMEKSGFRINTNDLKEYAGILREQTIAVEAEILKMAGMEFNISSPKQLGEVLFDKLKIIGDAKRTKTRQYSTNEEVLVRLKDKHEIVSKVLDYRGLKKLLSTYVETLPKLINSKTGKVHTSYEQAWVATGRLSSKNPNLQNIPVRDERGREIRKAFVASGKDYILMSADYSQIELRLMAHLSGDENMIEAFMNGEDIHSATAARIYGIDTDQVTKDMRRKAKTANFGIIYGISAFGLSQRLNIPRYEARELIENYFNTYKKVKEYMDRSINIAKEKGYVETIFGRRRYLKDIYSANSFVRGIAERNAINAPLQGSAADIIKLAMVNIHKKLKSGFKTKMILQVHDELIFDVYREEMEKVRNIVNHEMVNAVTLKVPVVVDIGTGDNWLEAH